MPRLLVALTVALTVAAIVATVPAAGGRPGRVPCYLGLKFGHRSRVPNTSTQSQIVLVFTDGQLGPCRVRGFPEVELIGPIHRPYGPIYELPTQVLPSESVALQPGEHAHATLTWLADVPSRHPWVPAYVRVVVSSNHGASVAMALPWRFGSVARQDAATHPGTYIGPIRPGTG